MQGCPSIYSWHSGVPRSARIPTIVGFLVLIVWACGFGSWAMMAPLASAVVASGSFVATGQNKQVQHLEGGIIRDVLVKEGDIVEPNQPLLRLDDTASTSKLHRLVLRRNRLLAIAARLQAEIGSSDKIQLPPGLLADSEDPSILAIVEAQRTELAARRASLFNQEEVLRKEIAGLKESIVGYQSQVDASKAQLVLFQDEIHAKRNLIEQQLIRTSDYLALKRAEVGLTGQIGELMARVGDAKERISRSEQQIAQLRSTAVEKAIEELRTTEAELDDLREQILAAEDVVERTEVRAPVRGVVIKMNQHTQGGVIPPGGIILELLPINDELIIEARLNPTEITHVKAGQPALVRLSALNQRLTPMIQGNVVYVSADTVSDQGIRRIAESNRQDSFVVRVRLDHRDLHKKVENFQPTPGMPADVYIETGQRTFFTYLMRPIYDTLSRAFREQ
jgi:HlyD family type I secretion membrane fusion protein